MPLYQKQVLWGWLTTGGKNRAGVGATTAQQRLAVVFGIRAEQQEIASLIFRYTPASAGCARRDDGGRCNVHRRSANTMSTKFPLGHDHNALLAPLYFILDSSRNEPALKRANIIMSAVKMVEEGKLHQDLYDLSCDLEDIAITVLTHIANIRDALSEEKGTDRNWGYVLERMEDAPLDVVVDLLDSIVSMNQALTVRFHQDWVDRTSMVRRFQDRFETILFRLRTRYYEEAARLEYIRKDGELGVRNWNEAAEQAPAVPPVKSDRRKDAKSAA